MPAETETSRSLMVLLSCLLGFTFLIALDATSVILTIFSITKDLNGDATESFWIGASYLLATCVAQPILSCMSQLYGDKNILLISAVLLGVGSLISSDSESMPLFLLGRTIQGLGAGGLTVLSYTTYGRLKGPIGHKFLAGMSLSMAVGTICGPILGSGLSTRGAWRWLFRPNIPCCLILGTLIYSTADSVYESDGTLVSLSGFDLVAATLSIVSIVSLLAGLSLAGSVYDWNDWQVIALLVLGSFCLVLFLVREMHPTLLWSTGQQRNGSSPLLGLRYVEPLQALDVCLGAMLLGLLMYALLFFLPIYYRVIKGHSAMVTGLLLLSQTLLMAPCGAMVFALVDKLGYQVQRVIVLGWLCTSCGFGLLTTLNVDRSVAAEVLLNLLSAFGIGALLPSLAISAKNSSDDLPPRQLHRKTQILVYMRYLGSASGLVILGLAFQRILQQNLSSSLDHQEAKALVKHATTLVYSISSMPYSERKGIFIQATQDALRTIWTALSVASAVMFLLSLARVMIMANRTSAEVSTQPATHSDRAVDLSARIESNETLSPDDDATAYPTYGDVTEKEVEMNVKL